MNNNRFRRRSAALLLLAAIITVSDVLPAMGPGLAFAAGSGTPAAQASGTKPPVVATNELGPYYQEMLADWTGKGYKPGTQTISIAGASVTAGSNPELSQVGTYESKSNVLIWKSDRDNWIEYKVDVAQDGLYEMAISYHPYNDPSKSNASINRRPSVLSMQLDGAYPFREAKALTFRRKFKDELPLKKNERGDTLRPRPIELNEWITEPLIDSAGSSTEPFNWYLSKGIHTIRFSTSDPIVIESLLLTPPTVLKTYDQVSAQYPQSAQTPAVSSIQTIQAEEVDSKNDIGIQMAADQDPLMEPKANGYEIFNALGGDRWQNGGESVTWSFEAPESGRYQIGLRAFQSYSSNKAVFRTIAIDGKVPFREFASYRFPYSPKWEGILLSDDNGKPYELYLEKGKHTFTMTATFTPFQNVIVLAEQATNTLRRVDEEIRSMTGGLVDTNRTWKVTEDFPELPQHMEEAKAQLLKTAEAMLGANGRRDNTLQTIETAVQDLTGYLKYPNEIPYHMDDISSIIEKVGGIRELLIKSPLMLDSLFVVPSGAKLPQLEATFWQKVKGTVHNFLYSFIRKEDPNKVDDDTLNVWVNRPRDYVNLLQEIVNDSFTPETGIKVKINLLANENLLVLANAAGLSPDVALGQPQDKSIDFAMRNALLDLSKFPDFQETAKQFAPGALVPFFYNGGYYALPETQSFKVLFYRKDILKRLGLSVPDTWDDVHEMLPTLQQNGYNFYVPNGDFLPFFYQNGADFFTKDGMKTAMNTPEAFKGFKQWTDLFSIYDVEKQIPNFYQHFRQGDIPIGVADYNFYIQLSVAAPELAGWWGIAPMPGVRAADGTVTRWAAGGQTTGFIYKNSKHPKESWSFLKWLMSASVQERYGSDLESFNGIAFRWNTANVEAFTHLPWPKEDMKVILEQWRWFKEAPNLPGSYFLIRELNNAWNRTVVDGMNFRESLEEAILNTDREMLRKEQEFGFVDSNGNVLHTLDLPQIKTPWEGVNNYVGK
jgi:ABC-type glycerol-3-phosphate transport system substrate-binding protein